MGNKPIAELAPEQQEARRVYYREHARKKYRENRDKILARNKAWREANPETVKARQREYHKKHNQNPENVKKRKERSAAWYQENKAVYLQKSRESRLKCQYGVDAARFDAMMRKQDGKCAICRSGPNSWHGRLVVDHCHQTGVVRGLLCDKCNVGISRLGDGTVETLLAAIRYIEQSQTRERKSA